MKFTFRNIGIISLISLSMFLMACSQTTDTPDPKPQEDVITTYTVALSAAGEVPAVTVPSQGSGSATITLNETKKEVSVTGNYKDLTGPAAAAHIHGPAAKGATGGVVFTLALGESTTQADKGNGYASELATQAGHEDHGDEEHGDENGKASGTLSLAATSITDAQIADLKAGMYYINLHTAANAPGELRGQIENDASKDTISTYSIDLSTDQEVPAIAAASSAKGSATIILNETTKEIYVAGKYSNLTGPAGAAHIHGPADRGATGPVVFTLDTVNAAATTLQPQAGHEDHGDAEGGSSGTLGLSTSITDAQITELKAGKYYINIHTAANAPGELRGQIDNKTKFTVRIDNVSTANTLATSTGSVFVPLSPGAYIVHSEDKSPLLEPRNPAGKALEAVAEDGNAALFPSEVPGSKVFNTPVGADGPGPIGPGGAYEFSVYAEVGEKLSFVTMFVQSNDWFYTPTDADDSISLFDANGNPTSGDVTNQIALWESGTEVDEEPGTGPNQAPRQAGPNTGTPESGTVGSLAGKGKSVTLNGGVIKVTITPQGK